MNDEQKRAQKRALALARARLKLKQNAKPVDVVDTDPLSVKNLAGAATEPLLSMASGMVSAPVSGLAGLGTMAGNALGLTDADPADVVRDVGGAMTYKPRTSGGQVANEAITYPFRKIAEGSDYVGGKVAEATNPATGAIVNALMQTAPVLAGGKLASSRMKADAPPAFLPPKVNNAMSQTATAIPRAVGKGAGVVKEAIVNRLPGGARRAASSTVNDMLGKRAPDVIKKLDNAKPGETAGQAAVDAGSYEFSALQKAMEKRHPSKAGAIKESQAAERAGDIQSISRTPLERANAEKFRSVESSPQYNAARKGVIDGTNKIVKNIDALISENIGNQKLVNALKEARRGLADKKGVVRTDANQVLSTVDGLKTAIKDSTNKFTKENLTNIKNNIVDLSPDYKQAQKTYARLSEPVNQMGIGKVLEDAISPRLGSAERANVFATAKANAPLTIKKGSNGGSRFKDLKDVMTEQQMKKINKVGGELNRDAKMSAQARDGSQAMNERMGTMFDIPKVGILERSVVIANAILKRIEGKNTKKALDIVSENMFEPKNMSKLLKEATSQERAILTEAIKKRGNPALVGGAIAGSEQQRGY